MPRQVSFFNVSYIAGRPVTSKTPIVVTPDDHRIRIKGAIEGVKVSSNKVNARTLAYFLMTGKMVSGRSLTYVGARDDYRWCNIRVSNKAPNTRPSRACKRCEKRRVEDATRKEAGKVELKEAGKMELKEAGKVELTGPQTYRFVGTMTINGDTVSFEGKKGELIPQGEVC